MLRTLVSVSTAIAITAISASAANAQQLEGTYKDWSVYSIHQQGRKVCYIASSPAKKTGNYRKRSEPYVLVTDVEPNVDEVSTSSGYPYKKGVEVSVTIDNDKYQLFTKGELAWAYDTQQDAKMVNAMKKGSKMEVRGTSRLNSYSNDTYSLSGFTNAYNRMKQLCK